MPWVCLASGQIEMVMELLVEGDEAESWRFAVVVGSKGCE